jgi:hypothetical protein
MRTHDPVVKKAIMAELKRKIAALSIFDEELLEIALERVKERLRIVSERRISYQRKKSVIFQYPNKSSGAVYYLILDPPEKETKYRITLQMRTHDLDLVVKKRCYDCKYEAQWKLGWLQHPDFWPCATCKGRNKWQKEPEPEEEHQCPTCRYNAASSLFSSLNVCDLCSNYNKWEAKLEPEPQQDDEENEELVEIDENGNVVPVESEPEG